MPVVLAVDGDQAGRPQVTDRGQHDALVAARRVDDLLGRHRPRRQRAGDGQPIGVEQQSQQLAHGVTRRSSQPTVAAVRRLADMISVVILYPKSDDTTFDMDYYTDQAHADARRGDRRGVQGLGRVRARPPSTTPSAG